TVGLGREQGSLKVRIGGRPAAGLAELAETLPVQLVDNQAHLLVDGSPRHRRQFVDWGVFHVEPAFIAVWRRYQRALQQRNALLRGGRSAREIAGWDNELAGSGELLDKFRRRYLEGFSRTAELWAQGALGELAVNLEYRPGWTEGQTLGEALAANRERDRQQGGTQVGPHRADLSIKVDGRPARDRVSRGQEKALAGTLLLAQTAVYRMATGRSCVLLLDDLPSELDSEHLARFVDQVVTTGAQTVITAISRDSLPASLSPRVFHVEQGKISQMV
ncbi:MAG: DNA replication/repair protein RecF, partial [Gammaproteobacteria bacterium]